MVKGFIIYKNGKIPFVIDKYRMELFTDDKILTLCRNIIKREIIFFQEYILALGRNPEK